MNHLHDAHVDVWANIHDARQHRSHISTWVRHNAGRLAQRQKANGFKFAALHEYTDAYGSPIFWRIRLKSEAGEKWIRPMRRCGDEKFDLGQPDFPDGTPLYRLDQLTNQDDAPVWVVEGESCVDALVDFGLTATTSGGADSAARADWQPLAGRDVTIWPDNDDAGARYANVVQDKLRALGCTVSMIEHAALGLPKKGDCVDWLAAYPKATIADLAALPKTTAPELPPDTKLDDEQAGLDFQESDDDRVARLAALSPLEYDRCRKEQAAAMKVRPSTLDAKVKAARAAVDTPQTPFVEPEPWHEPVDPAMLLSDISATVRRFIVLEDKQADAAALWIAFTWFADVAEVAPLAIINAPEKACGKSQLLTVFGRLVARPLPAANSTAAFLFRAVAVWAPTVLIDEADTFIRDNAELKGLVNAGHTRQNALVGRVVGDHHEPKLFNVWGAKAMAGIALEKHLSDPTMSRAVVFNMRRKLPGETVERLRHAEPDLFERLASQLARFADDYRDAFRSARPALPDELDDRAQDNWEPLLSVARCAGQEWLARAVAAALELSGKSEPSPSTGSELLADIQHVFDKKHAERISTADLIAALTEDEEAAWATYNRGKPLTPRQLANLLRGYGITSKTIRLGYETAKGYERAHFQDTFARYLSASSPPPDLPVTSVTNPTSPMAKGNSVLRIDESRYARESGKVTLHALRNRACDGVTDESATSTGIGGHLDDVVVF